MPQQTQLYIVASRHPRVGRTLLSRLLIDFLRMGGRPLVGYDLGPRKPALAGCFPNLVWPVDIADTRGAVRWRCSIAFSAITGARRSSI